MPTKALGAGTCNLSVNVRTPVRAALGRLAFQYDVSMGEFVRRMLAKAAAFWSVKDTTRKAGHLDIEAARMILNAMADGLGPEDEPVIRAAVEMVKESGALDIDASKSVDLETVEACA